MASSYSDLLRLELIGAGEQAGLWGETTNNNLGSLVEQAIAGVTTITLSGGAGSVTLSALNGAPDQSRSAVLKFVGTPSGQKDIIIPTKTKLYVVRNDCGQTITVKTVAQPTGVTILNGEATLVFCDGTNAVAGIATAGVGPTTVANGGTGATSFTGGFVKSPGGTGVLTSSATVNLGTEVTGTLPVTNGGTGASDAGTARTNLGLGTVSTINLNSSNTQFLRGDGTFATPAASGVTSVSAGTGISVTGTSSAPVVSLASLLTPGNYTNAAISVNGSGVITAVSSGTSGGVTSVGLSGGSTGLTVSNSPITSSGTMSLGGVLAMANGGTGVSASAFPGGVVYGVSASQIATNIPGTAGQVLISNGSSAPSWVNQSSISAGGLTGSPSITVNALTATSATVGGNAVLTTTTGARLGSANTFTATNTYSTVGEIVMNAATSSALRFSVTGSGFTSGMSPTSIQLGTANWGLNYSSTPEISISTGGSFTTSFRQSGNFQSNNSPNWATTSDINIKTNLRPINDALGKLCALQPKHFEYKDELGTTRSGFIAQEFETVFPGHTTETVVAEKYKEFLPEGVDKLKALDLNLVPYLVKAIQELKAELDAAKAEIEALKAQ